eukprot:8631089-Lingulodinium_polyedra.AAC.1
MRLRACRSSMPSGGWAVPRARARPLGRCQAGGVAQAGLARFKTGAARSLVPGHALGAGAGHEVLRRPPSQALWAGGGRPL